VAAQSGWAAATAVLPAAAPAAPARLVTGRGLMAHQCKAPATHGVLQAMMRAAIGVESIEPCQCMSCYNRKYPERKHLKPRTATSNGRTSECA
jgi:hypothetical protein